MKDKHLRRVKAELSEWFELPEEIMLDLPRIEILGNDRIHIENHRGIIEYTQTCVRVNTNAGVIRITGGALNVRNIGSEEIIVLGSIEAIEYQK